MAVVAVQHVRRMRGGAQSHLMRCADGNFYVVKFQDNPQHTRVLANEMLATQAGGGRVDRAGDRGGGGGSLAGGAHERAAIRAGGAAIVRAARGCSLVRGWWCLPCRA